MTNPMFSGIFGPGFGAFFFREVGKMWPFGVGFATAYHLLACKIPVTDEDRKNSPFTNPKIKQDNHH